MQMPKTDTLFLTLRIFSATGGIEKLCRLAGKALHELSGESLSPGVKIFSLYDEPADVNTTYFPSAIFSGFGKNRFKFISAALKAGFNSRVVILSHVNLLVVGFIIKLISPKTKIILFAHGIEVWRIFPGWKKKMLHQCDKILPVSEFTKEKMIQLHQLPAEKFTILNNCLDPFLPTPVQTKKDVGLLARYGIDASDKVLLTLTRMAAKEKYKGYDKVIQAVHDLKEKYPTIKYLVVGKYDAEEKERLEDIITRLALQDHIIFTGFIRDEELAAHFNLADLYIMPSQKEGFGIVFIEAMFYGKPVIAGNIDGSVDALKGGTFGLLVNPTNQQQINNAIIEVFNNTEKYIPNHQEVMKHFSFAVYKEKLGKIIS
jgi:phosphatidylinositol alpha-1,6-mannosyltransferase